MEKDGPRLLLKARRRETAADRMSEQQKEFEERSGPVKDEVQQATSHNETHPKLKRQLDKRRSITEFADQPVKRMRLNPPDPDRGSRQSRRRETTTRKLERTRRARNNRVAKRRDRRPCTCSKCLNKQSRNDAADLCVYVVNKRIGTDTKHDETLPPTLKPKRSVHGSDHSVDSRKWPSRNQSVSSYNSFDSSTHQPVV